MVGKTISHYEILDKIGEGGMGVVYKANDTKLSRTVALKFLRAEAFGGEDHKNRFVREAQTAAALTHPNICTVYEIDEDEDNIFISMAYNEGVNLHKRIAAGPLDPFEAVDIAIQVAGGLDAAHRKGIFHCDIKTSNVMVSPDGRAQIMDFGLARIAEETEPSRTASTLGTMGYMSPEQARGDRVDHRTDIWSLGVCLYEMVSGQLPFTGDYAQAVFYSIVNEHAKPLADFGLPVPDKLEQIVARAMAKRPEDRFQTAAEMISELKLVTRKQPGQQAGSSTDEQSSIAVLPFADMSRDKDQEFFCDGIAEEIINALTRVGGLRVVARTSAFAFKGMLQDVREIGRALDVTTVLEGSVRKSGDMLRITAQLINVADGFHLWSERFDRKLEDVFAIQDEISQAIVQMLKTTLVGEPEAPHVKRYTDNLDAYTLYLKGRYFWNKRSEEALKSGLQCFEKAIEEDPRYALAYAGLADTYNLLGFYSIMPPKEVFPKAIEAALKAMDLDEAMPEAHTSLAFACMFYDWDWVRAEVEFKRALELNPDYPTANHWYAEYLVLTGKAEEAVAQSKKALESDPLSLIINTLLGWAPHYQHDFERAIRQYHKTLEMDPDFVPAHFFLGLTYIQKARYDDAIAQFKQATSLFGESTLFIVVQGYAYAMAGVIRQAEMIVAEMKNLSDQRYVQPYYTAALYFALGDEDRTFAWLDKAYEARDTWLAFLKVDPIWNDLRSNPRFVALLEKLNLAP